MNNASMPDVLRRSFIGSDRTIRFATLASQNTAYPPHNVIQTGEHSYLVTVAVAGFTRDEISIEVENDLLTISGTKGDAEKNPDHWIVLWSGLAFRDFSRQFRMGEFVEVTSASLTDGVLNIELVRNLPETMKPKRIDIR